MKIQQIQLLPLLISLSCLNTIFAKLHGNDESKRSDLKEAMKNLMGIEKDPKLGKPLSTNRKVDAATLYMQKLYKLYSTNKSFSDNGEYVVRSTNPKIELIDGTVTMSFDVSSMKQSESVVRAELHFDERRKRPSSKVKTKKTLKVIAIYGKNKLRRKLQATKDGWLGFDATEVILDVRYLNGTVLWIQVEKKNQIMKATDIVKKYNPFLLIFSKSGSTTIEKDFIAAIKEDQKIQENKKRLKRSMDYYAYTSKKDDPKHEEFLHTQLEHFRRAGPSILRNKKKNQKHSNRRKKVHVEKSDPMMGFGNALGSYIKKTVQPSPAEKNSELMMVLVDDGHAEQKCEKRKMIVNFEEIGWGDYVVQPTSFEANYCSGSCTFRLDKYANSHAIFQSLMHTAGLKPYVPNVCCAPEKFDSQTLLYFQGPNLVLRTFPRMTVTSCACN